MQHNSLPSFPLLKSLASIVNTFEVDSDEGIANKGQALSVSCYPHRDINTRHNLATYILQSARLIAFVVLLCSNYVALATLRLSNLFATYAACMNACHS